MGGSPRVRGRGPVPSLPWDIRGWIPAGAGEGIALNYGATAPRVDPRGCGGGLTYAARRQLIGGGSPRVRGRVFDRLDRFAERGWIPAGAGEGNFAQHTRTPGGVDPRGCGGGGAPCVRTSQARGGSPRVRGRVAGAHREDRRCGWIPAGAGEGDAVRLMLLGMRVDPRGCGGGAIANHGLVLRSGGSPRVRGRGRRRNPLVDSPGWIPAGAGEGHRTQPTGGSRRVDPRGCGGGGQKGLPPPIA